MFFKRIQAAYKAFVQGHVGTSQYLRDYLPGADMDYERLAGNPLDNSIVSNCVMWAADNFIELRLQALTASDDLTPPAPAKHPLLNLVTLPNPAYDGAALIQATVISYLAHGNAYWLKRRNSAGAVVQLYWVPHWQLTPRSFSPSNYIDYYDYTGAGYTQPVLPDDVVHFRYGIDPGNPRLGMSRLRAVFREIAGDNDASTYWAAVMRNMGLWGCIVTSSDPRSVITPDQAAIIKQQLAAGYTGEGRGKPLVLSSPVQVNRAGLDPAELLPAEIRNVPEARITGALRISAIVVGLTSSRGTMTYANVKQAQLQAYQDCLLPMGARFAATMSKELLPDFPRPRIPVYLAYDASTVAALAPDQDALYRRSTIAVTGGWMTVNEARAKAGLPLDPDGDIYLRRYPPIA